MRRIVRELQVVGLDVGEQALPDRRHAGRDGHALALEQLVQRLAVERTGPGSTSLAPTMHAAYGRPQALTWNIGTTGRIASRAEQFSASGSAAA